MIIFLASRETWADFPIMNRLRELDLRACKITYLDVNIFKNVTNLTKLFLSGNNIISITSNAFEHLTNLIHLDLSYNNGTTVITGYRATDIYESFMGGLELPNDVFIYLQQLRVLDLSHTKITGSSAIALNCLGPKLEQLSLCHTGIQILIPQTFTKSNLRVLDISGNPAITSNMEPNIFEGLENKLEILFFKYSNVKSLAFLNYLQTLTILSLKGNTINQLSNDTFENNKHLEILDLSSNHISNWYTRVFVYNPKLQILNVRDNNINIMTNEMINDFLELQFLLIGNNNFICSCLLREFLDRAKANNCKVQCTVEQLGLNDNNGNNSIQLRIAETSSQIYESFFENMVISYHNMNHAHTKFEDFDVQSQVYQYNNTSALRESYIRISTKNHDVVCNRSQQVEYCALNNTNGNEEYEESNELSFQLLDFNDLEYRCYNSSSNQFYLLHEIEVCVESRDWQNEVPVPRSKFVITLICISVVLLFLYLICYYKWWYIRYFFILFKNATILSFLDKEKELLHNDDNTDTPYNYDVFVSYCDENRDWVLQHFLPNIEDETEINVCLHERDFQVGLSILENIIYCMDRSRALLLIVSESFLLSQWCQFEMHLAQYR